MSRESAEAFCNQLESDGALYREVASLGGTVSGELLVSAPRVVELGVRKGFSFSARELCDAWVNVDAKRAGSELSEAQLDAISGGAGKTAQMHFLMFMADGTPVRAEAGNGNPIYHYADDFAP